MVWAATAPAAAPEMISADLARRLLVPLLVAVAGLGAWEALVAWYQLPAYLLPPPSLVISRLASDGAVLLDSWWLTVTITLQAFALALVGGVGLAVLFSQSRLIELALFPYAVVLQVTPVVAIAPLVIIWVGLDHADRALLILAWVVAFFPILSNMTLGLRSVDHNLLNLFQLYGASRWQVLWRLRLPAALPYLLAGMKISGGLALIGAVVAEFVAGSGTSTGLAWRIVEAGNRLDIARMFAALALLSATGITIFGLLTALEYLVLRHWHESAARREN